MLIQDYQRLIEYNLMLLIIKKENEENKQIRIAKIKSVIPMLNAD